MWWRRWASCVSYALLAFALFAPSALSVGCAESQPTPRWRAAHSATADHHALPPLAPAPFALVELFTAPGCAGCRPAAASLAELAERPDVIALGYHMNYADDGGVDAPLRAGFLLRQQHYARRFHLSSLYTPQAVIDGAQELLGSDASKLGAAAQAASAVRRGGALALSAELAPGLAHVRFRAEGVPLDATLYVAVVQRAVTARADEVGDGRGPLQHANVVRSLVARPLAGAKLGAFDAPSPALPPSELAVVGFVQSNDMTVWAAARASTKPLEW